ncbi:trigger factor-like isoform X2 [Impatiens glandulifera]|uniref:trigger factor-like isoform X2 n=1 Tax=Impatiens glandulifera TaxID=253017 RepID=UPI001FB098D7|nr:trigger factor-like isoform X2 [Impatiens glandulifera]
MAMSFGGTQLLGSLDFKIRSPMKTVYARALVLNSIRMRYSTYLFHQRPSLKYPSPVYAVVSSEDIIEVSSGQFEGFTASSNTINNNNTELKISVEVSGDKTQTIFDRVFDKMVEDAQPIPGFRRVKGGKTPNIPRDILLEVLGPMRVYKQVIKKIINTTIAEYIHKEGLQASKDLRVEQSFEELESTFEPGGKFIFDAVVRLQEPSG